MIVPGKAACSIVHYEDDGISQSYVKDYALTRIDKSVSGRKTTVRIAPREGSYAGACTTRRIILQMEGVGSAPASVKLNGSLLSPEAVCLGGGKLCINLPESSATEHLSVEINL